MINIRVDRAGEDRLKFTFDDGFSVEKSVKPINCAMMASQTSKKYRETIRDWLFNRYKDNWRDKERVFLRLFRMTEVTSSSTFVDGWK